MLGDEEYRTKELESVAVCCSLLGDEESARSTVPTSCSIGVRVLQYVGARLLRVLCVLRVLHGDGK